MDILTEIFNLVSPRAVAWRKIERRGRWALSIPDNPLPRFGLVSSGRCHCQPSDGDPFFLDTGDYMLMTRAPRYTLCSDPESAARMVDRAARAGAGEYVSWDESRDGEPFQMLGCYFDVESRHVSFLQELFPKLLLIRSSDDKASRLSRLIELIRDEAAHDTPGSAMIMTRLVEVMLIQVLREPLLQQQGRHVGWYSGMADAQVRQALQLIHADVARPWTVELLANRTGMSRATFARRFVDRVGITPAAYVSSWRIALAKDALLKSRRSLEDIAISIGFLSESAFSTAFKRNAGVPPATYRKQHRVP